MIQFAGQQWAPTRYTPPLRGRLELSDGPRLCQLMEQHWRTADGQLIALDEDQHATLNHLLERYPLDWPNPQLRGRLRFRQAVVSMGRQNGKSIIGGALALYGLVQHVTAPSVVGIATSVEQANVVYQRVRFAVDHDPLLASILVASGTRGIRWRDGRGGYHVKPALREGLQSVPVTLGVADELHLMARELWYSIVNGQRAQLDALVAGITTAGDDLSHLLKELYQRGAVAVDRPDLDERFGFFLWEAPGGSTIHTPGALAAANPAIAIGRVDLDTVIGDIAASPITDQQRYALNQFVAAAKSWADLDQWDKCPTIADLDEDTDTAAIVYGVDRAASWEWVTITANTKNEATGTVDTIPVVSLRGVDRDRLVEILAALLDATPGAAVALDSRRLSSVGKELRDAGHEVWIITATEMAQASADVYARITRQQLRHAGLPVLRRQLATRHQKRLDGASWIITAGAAPVDAIVATFIGAYVADVRPPAAQQLY